LEWEKSKDLSPRNRRLKRENHKSQRDHAATAWLGKGNKQQNPAAPSEAGGWKDMAVGIKKHGGSVKTTLGKARKSGS